MSITYTPTTNFGAKDSLPTNDPAKVIKGSEFTTEFTAIQTAFGLAAPAASPTFTGTVTIASVDINGGAIDGTTIGGTTPAAGTFSSLTATTADINGGTIDGVTIGGSSAGAITGTTGQFNTSLNVDGTVTADGLTVDGATVLDVGDEGTLQVGPTTTVADENQTIEMRGSNGSNELQRFQISNRGEDGTVDFKYGRAGAAPTKAISIGAGTGDISFYEDTGTTAKFFWDASAESLGIGTTSPSTKLDVVTSGVSQIQIQNTSGTTKNTQLMFADNVGSKWRIGMDVATNNNTNNFQLYNDVAASAALTVDSSGNVGIGTSSPSEKLTIAGDVQIGESSGGEKLKFVGASGKYNFLVGKQVNVDNAFEITPSTAVGGNTFSTPAVVVNSSGNVGVGTSSPSGLLNVHSASGDTNLYVTTGNTAASTNIFFGDTDNSSIGRIVYDHNGDYMKFRTNGSDAMRIDSSGNLLVGKTASGYSANGFEVTSTGLIYAPAGSASAPAITFSGDTNTGIGFGGADILYMSTGGSERMRIDSSGNLLVGTTSEINLGDTTGSGVQLNGIGAFVKRTCTTSTQGLLQLNNIGTTGNVVEFYIDGIQTGCLGVASGAALTFVNGTGSSEAMRLDSSGNLLVGKTSASKTTAGALISPSGTSEFISSGNEVTPMAIGSSNDVTLTLVTFHGASATAGGSISISGGTSVAYNTSSDARLKENIADAESASERIDAIQVRQFDWKADGSHQDYGMVAQELLEVAPEAVSGDPESDDMMGVDYSKLVPMLVKEIQSLRARVAQLEGV